MIRFAKPTKTCAYTSLVTLDHLTKCLKRRTYVVVKGKLYKRTELPSVLAILRMLFGQHTLAYTFLVSNIISRPDIRYDLESLITFSLSIKALCDSIYTI